jgi:hypothetical protein
MRYGSKALVARLALADLAERSLDLQYYIWDADTVGHLLADRVIRAASLRIVTPTPRPRRRPAFAPTRSDRRLGFVWHMSAHRR